ncbi:MAG: TetR/AcrR family transcriptional regulator [Dongiaceae bacterium]
MAEGTAARAIAGEEGLSPKAQQILAAAGRSFLEQGYGATSMDGIARLAGVSKATLYAHFSGKDMLFAAVVEAECRQLSLGLDAAPPFEAGDLRAALVRVARQFIERLLSSRAFAIYRMVIAETPRFPELGRIFFESGPERMIGRVADFLAAADARGLIAVPAPRRAAMQFIGLIRGHNYLRPLLGLAPVPESELGPYIESCVDLFLAGHRRS